jgi:serine/threonine protein kinase
LNEASSPVSVGQIIDGKFRLERVIGSGGMGVVVAATHLKLGKTVALKFLLPEACENREAVNRFLREGQALARITSAHVARVMDVGTLAGGEPYIVMEYLEGSDLGALIKRRGRLPVSEATAFLLQACEAIAEAHANGIIHRDLKPSNLFLTRAADGSPLVKVLDFGISKAVVPEPPANLAAHTTTATATTAPAARDTNTGALVGSPLYMSPEQIRNARRVDERTDIWSLGVILFELVTGRPPFEGETVSGTLAAVCADPPKSLRTVGVELPRELEAPILRCLEKAPERRYDSVAALAWALLPFAPEGSRESVERIARVLGTEPEPADTSPSAEPHGSASGRTLRTWEGDTMPMSKRSSPKRLVALVGGVAALCSLGAFALFAGNGGRREPAPEPSTARMVSAAVPVAVERARGPSAPSTMPSDTANSGPPPVSAEAELPGGPQPPSTNGSAEPRTEPSAKAAPRRDRPRPSPTPGGKPPSPASPPDKTHDGTEDRK